LLNTPLHPLLVHFPIALLLVGTVFQIIAIRKKDFFDRAAFVLLSLGFLSGIAAFLSGPGAERFASTHWGSAYLSIVHIHKVYSAITMLLFGGALALRMLHYFVKTKWVMPLVLALCLAGSVALALTGHYGGQMVYVQKHAEILITNQIQ
jgi:Predicted membrane protein